MALGDASTEVQQPQRGIGGCSFGAWFRLAVHSERRTLRLWRAGGLRWAGRTRSGGGGNRELAGQIADTESEVARVHDEIAENDAAPMTDQASEHADTARRFGAQERQVAERTAKTSPADQSEGN